MNLFASSANAIYWCVIAGLGLSILSVPALMIAWARTPYSTGEQVPPQQPVKFDHRHHVRDDGIGCEFCHGGAMTTASAGVPATAVCMGCHSQIWTQSPEVSPVRHSYFADEPIRWIRVNRLPDFVFFDHSAHVTHGVGCVTCHGRVDLMSEVAPATPLTMRWCLDCHREPEKHLRPLDKITDMEWEADRPNLGREIRDELGVRSVMNCTGCHR